MRGVWWSAFALLLVAVAVGALRTAQVEEISRVSRRLPSTIKNSDSIRPEDASPSPRTRTFRRREETTTREIPRSRSRSRSSDTTSSTTETLKFQSERNERFDSKRQNSRTRSRPIINEENFDTTKNRDTQSRSRSRQVTRRVTSQPTTTPTPLPISSPTTIGKEFTDSAFNDITKTVPKEVTDPNTQFRRRSSTESVIEPTTTRTRNRINTRTNIRALDLEVSGTANALTTAFKEPTTAKANDLRNPRKLRYKTRQAEVDSNLTGEGLTLPNDITSSQIGENITSQTESKLVSRSTTEKVIRQTTERLAKTSTIKTTKVVKRPISRGKGKTPIATVKPKVSDEVHEDDNYPETFKALIQAKNASTQASSPSSESLSVKASQKVYNTYNTSSQSILTAPDSEKQFPLRSKINSEENKNESTINDTKQEETTLAPKQPKLKSEYRLRGSYIPRNKKSSSFSSSTISSTSFSPVTQRSYKFSRKQKIGTTETTNVDNSIKTKRVENNNNLLKKPVIRSSLYSRRNVSKNFSVNSEVPRRVEIDRSDKSLAFKSKPTLPRTSYYSRVRSNSINKTLSTNSSMQSTTEEILTVEKVKEKVENTAELPLIYTNTNSVVIEKDNKDSKINNDSNNFVITVNSRESTENNTLNEVVDKTEDSGNKPSQNVINTTQKYHATYKDSSNGVSLQNREKVTVAPPIRNIQTRKYGRKPLKRKEDLPHVTPIVRSSRKYSDTFSKTTEASSNGIIGEPEKVKNKFSSKYRASYLDKPFYKPTVPTVTPSTAWLKFFVTDHLLSKSVEEPNWFEDEDFSDLTTEQMSRQNATSPTCMHETAFPPVEGEEIQLGPDMNAISITKSRSPLASADLKLSESLAQSLQVMSVEASNHSPSVTVSIFDALAEILTSTPKPRISTTEVLQFQTTNSDVKQTLAGVSNSINVNSVKDLTSQDTYMSTDVVATVDKNVQTTEQSTSPVFNRMPVEGNITPSQIIEAGTPTVNTLSTLPFPTSPPSTPVSARRPFAIKVLYTDTERTTDRTTIVTTTDKSTTDTSTRVYNTVSDLILSNNKIVSSELTSMLSNNIKNIIENMDEDSKARLSVDMVKLLNTLIPKLSKPITLQDDLETPPNTTPYSLEDIKDTENIDINNENTSDILVGNVLQNVEVMNVVNSTTRNIETEITTISPTETVNSTFTLNKLDSTTIFPLETQSISVTSKIDEMNFKQSTEPSGITLNSPKDISTATSANTDTDLSSPVADVVIVNNDSGLSLSNVTNNPSTVPFLTNFILNDYNDMDNSTLGQTSPIPPMTSLQLKELEDIENIQDPSQLSRLQLWILSKKARVLKMIEDIIRNHNDEILNAPLTELVNDTNQNNVFLSSRLSDIVNTMNMTATNNTTNQNILNTPTSTPLTITETTTSSPVPSTSSQTNINLSISEETFSSTQAGNTMTTTSIPLETASVVLTTTELPAFQLANDIADAFSATTVGTTLISVDDSETRLQMTSLNADLVQSTTIGSIMETTTSLDSEVVTESGINESLIETTTTANIDTTTLPPRSEISSIVNNISNGIRIGTTSTHPKKDYVIFGILPNNTVVRKDPNDNVLETLTEASPYIIYGVLPNNTVIRKFPNGTRVPRIMQKIDILPISPWSLRNPYSPIHNIPAIVRPQSNPIRVSTNTVTFKDTSNNETEKKLTTDTVNNLQITISSSALNIKDSSLLGITTSTNKPAAEKSTASHVLSLRTTTMLPSVDEILLNSISSATKEEMVISSMTSSTSEPRILTLDIDPETKQIRTEKPVDGNGNAVFKFIPIDEVTVSPQESNVLRLASTKTPKTAAIKETQTTMFESNTQLPVEMTSEVISSPSDLPILMNTETTTAIPQSSTTLTTTTMMPTATESTSTSVMVTEITTTITTSKPTTNIPIPVVTQTVSAITSSEPTTDIITSTLRSSPTVTMLPIQTSTSSNIFETAASNQKDAELLQSLLQGIDRTPKNLNNVNNKNFAQNIEQNDKVKLLQALLAGGGQNLGGLLNRPQTTTVRSIEDDIRQFEEDTKLLRALLLATGRNPQELNLPNLDAIRRVTSSSATNGIPSTTPVIVSTLPPTTTPTTTSTTTTTTTPTTTTPTTTTSTTTTTTTTTTPSTTTPTVTTTIPPSTTTRLQSEKTTTSSLNDDLRKLQEDTKLLQALLLATGNQNAGSLPIISGLTSNIRVASNPLTTSIESNPTTAFNLRPVYTTRPSPVFTSFTPETVSISTLQPQQSSTENIRISTTFRPFTERSTTDENLDSSTVTTRRSKAARFQITTDIPSTSTFSDEEDLLFLQNLKSVLSSKTNGQDPETALANRVIALAVERSLNEIQGGKLEASSTVKPTTTTQPTTTTRPITTRPTTTTARLTTAASTLNTPSIEDDIKQFKEDTKLLQALLKATGQDPSKFNIPTLNTIRPASDVTSEPNVILTTVKPYGAKIAVKDDLKNEQDDAKLLQTLIKLQDAQETTTQRGKIALTGQSSDEALKKLLQQAQPAGMVSEATKSSISLSTEYGNSNDALLAALLKEQGFGPTTASSIDEQLRLAALLNQVVVTPKARRTTTPPPPPSPRRPLLDGLAWLWQQWRETAPGPGQPRPNRRPEQPTPSNSPSAATSSRVNWFGSGPFVGNADERPTSNRIPLEPPSVVTSEQGPGRGQLVSAAINVTRAFSQFLGAAIQGAAQTVQSVIRAGQRAATDAYTGGSG